MDPSWKPPLRTLCRWIYFKRRGLSHIEAPHASGKSTYIPRHVQARLKDWTVVHATFASEVERLSSDKVTVAAHGALLQDVAALKQDVPLIAMVDLSANGSMGESLLLLKLAHLVGRQDIFIVTMSAGKLPSYLSTLSEHLSNALEIMPVSQLVLSAPQRQFGWVCLPSRDDQVLEISKAIEARTDRSHLVLCMRGFQDETLAEIATIQAALPDSADMFRPAKPDTKRVLVMDHAMNQRHRIEFDEVHVILANSASRVVFDRTIGRHTVMALSFTTPAERSEMVSYAQRCTGAVTMYSSFPSSTAFVEAGQQLHGRTGFSSLSFVATAAQMQPEMDLLEHFVHDELAEIVNLLRRIQVAAIDHRHKNLVCRGPEPFDKLLAIVGDPRLALWLIQPSPSPNARLAKALASALLAVGLDNVFDVAGDIRTHVEGFAPGLVRNLAAYGTLWALMSVFQGSMYAYQATSGPLYRPSEFNTLTENCVIVGDAAKVLAKVDEIASLMDCPAKSKIEESLTIEELDELEAQLVFCFQDQIVGIDGDLFLDMYSGKSLEIGPIIDMTVRWKRDRRQYGLYLGPVDGRLREFRINDLIIVKADHARRIPKLRTSYAPRTNPEPPANILILAFASGSSFLLQLGLKAFVSGGDPDLYHSSHRLHV
ncbi:hypothetical protein B0I35DRAFT_481190 [Stachybotrys elegans]|uniref:Uncharacterized protein n=1 Tax=Stachybotrys elegans TaxID=80388 RepID=A0A8K0WMU5_9HYPO|nr:hypothetical protein B0I35DRAFT_481190 [Stachybotrys elegans]